jgi:hypothetical protein
MIVILIGTGLMLVLSFFVAKCSDRGKPTRARTHWNQPPPSTRSATLDDLRKQAEERARRVVPDAALSRISGRQVDPTGLVDLEYGTVGFEFVAFPGGTTDTCGVEEGLAWQGWAQRLRSVCTDPPLTPHCTFAAALARAFPTLPAAVQFVLETAADGTGQAWTFWPLGPKGPPVAVPDDCAAQ